jgi:hypothetical protein
MRGNYKESQGYGKSRLSRVGGLRSQNTLERPRGRWKVEMAIRALLRHYLTFGSHSCYLRPAPRFFTPLIVLKAILGV